MQDKFINTFCLEQFSNAKGRTGMLWLCLTTPLSNQSTWCQSHQKSALQLLARETFHLPSHGSSSASFSTLTYPPKPDQQSEVLSLRGTAIAVTSCRSLGSLPLHFLNFFSHLKIERFSLNIYYIWIYIFSSKNNNILDDKIVLLKVCFSSVK